MLMNISELYLKTAFCCMACDGEIAKEETSLLSDIANKSNLFKGLDIQSTINGYVDRINKEGSSFLSNYLKEVSDSALSDDQAVEIVKLAIKTIEADNNIEYSEISFFKKIRKRLSISDDIILASMPDKEDYLLPDIEAPDDLDWSVSFSEISLAIQ